MKTRQELEADVVTARECELLQHRCNMKLYARVSDLNQDNLLLKAANEALTSLVGQLRALATEGQAMADIGSRVDIGKLSEMRVSPETAEKLEAASTFARKRLVIERDGQSHLVATVLVPGTREPALGPEIVVWGLRTFARTEDLGVYVEVNAVTALVVVDEPTPEPTPGES